MDARKVLVVTGGSGGIGFAIVDLFLKSGFRAAYFGSNTEKVASSLQELSRRHAPESICGRALDIRDPGAIQRFFAEVAELWGGVSVLINNAGISPKEDGKRIPLHLTSPEGWQDVLTVNLTGAFLCTRQVLPGMIRDSYGRIIMIGSIAARTTPLLAGAAYAASKAALSGLARAIVGEYSSLGITANIVAPGNIVTGMTGGLDSPTNRDATKRIPVGKPGEPADIAETVLFLCSPQGAFVNGATLDVNGGKLTVP